MSVEGCGWVEIEDRGLEAGSKNDSATLVAEAISGLGPFIANRSA